MEQIRKAEAFAQLHIKGDPLILYNIWDAGSSKDVASAGAKAVATGSWSVAAAQGFEDGEQIPLDLVVEIVGRIAATVKLPLTVDMESGYGGSPAVVAESAARLIQAGAVGINFEDQVVNGQRLYSIAVQCDRIRAIRKKAELLGAPLFINARTDLFLLAADTTHADMLEDAKERAARYAEAGANGFFVPGLAEEGLIGELCQSTELPVNIMMMDGAAPIERLAALGAARVSFGPAPYVSLMNELSQRAAEVYSSA